jgi:hypothetical protein
VGDFEVRGARGGRFAFAIASSRTAALSADSRYSLAASLAGPRLSDTAVTSTFQTSESLERLIRMPALTVYDGLTRWSSTRARPDSIACAAMVLVL